MTVPASPQPDVELRLPLDPAYVAVLRMTTASIAARLDFTLDDIEDLRMAVGEACAMMLEGADPEGQLRATFVLGQGEMQVRVSADTTTTSPPDRDSFGWQVLASLSSEVSAEASDHEHAILLRLRSGAPV